MTTVELAATLADGADEPAIIHLVPHTHWDREWYEPFQVFRMRLVELVDELLDSMDADERLAFTLDGQVATIDDYLEIRPEARARIERLIKQGRLAIGPWQILMDEFLVSGETLIRNLEIGWHAAEAFGAAMPVGYLPDMFGHVAQMPQILRRAGIRHAVVWRGVPAAIDRHSFTWRAPDGSSVRAEYLVGGYGNGAYLLAIPDRLADKVARYVDASRGFYGNRSILAMYGTDHAVPSPRLAQIVEDANAQRDDIVVRIETLTRYIQTFDAAVTEAAGSAPAPAPAWTGELRSAARANMLMNVTSARIDIKIAAGRAERILERYAEPLAALHGGAWPGRLLELAWRRVVDNSAHDSICGCSHDAVVNQVLTRFAEAEQIGRGIVNAAIRPLAAATARGGAVIVNPSPHDRVDLVELDLAVPAAWDAVELELGDGRRVTTQLVERPEAVLRRLRLSGRQVPELFDRRLHGRELFGHSLDGHVIRRDGLERTLILLVDDPAARPDFDVDSVLDAAAAAVADGPDEAWDVTVVRGDRRRLVAAVPAPALGAATVRPVESAVPSSGAAAAPATGSVVVGDRSIGNGLVHVTIGEHGTFDVRGGGVRLADAGRLVDGGDHGDTYNYGPPAEDRLIDQPLSVHVTAAESGPIRGRLEIVARHDWPIGLTPDGRTRSAMTVPVAVTTTIEIRTGEPFARVAIAFDNSARDHRVRWHVPLPSPTDRSAAEGQFAVVERGLTAEAGHGEVPTPTFPAHGWVHAAGVTILLDHALEYELVDGRELALTVLRSTGLISRNDNPYREDPAGPEVLVPGAQMIGPWRFTCAILPHRGGWSVDDVRAAAEAYHLAFVTSPGMAATGSADAESPDGGDGPLPGTGLRIDGSGVVLSALRRRDEDLELRVVAQTDAATTAVISGWPIHEARDVDLLGRLGSVLEVEPDASLRVSLGPWEIRTIRIRDRAL
ncbi:MAG TPA: alpha-mannosidase [Patescibacteria group bacterium]|nr:alpha-mannosidase [Patescibacteria group bacterium]